MSVRVHEERVGLHLSPVGLRSGVRGVPAAADRPVGVLAGRLGRHPRLHRGGLRPHPRGPDRRRRGPGPPAGAAHLRGAGGRRGGRPAVAPHGDGDLGPDPGGAHPRRPVRGPRRPVRDRLRARVHLAAVPAVARRQHPRARPPAEAGGGQRADARRLVRGDPGRRGGLRRPARRPRAPARRQPAPHPADRARLRLRRGDVPVLRGGERRAPPRPRLRPWRHPAPPGPARGRPLHRAAPGPALAGVRPGRVDARRRGPVRGGHRLRPPDPWRVGHGVRVAGRVVGRGHGPGRGGRAAAAGRQAARVPGRGRGLRPGARADGGGPRAVAGVRRRRGLRGGLLGGHRPRPQHSAGAGLQRGPRQDHGRRADAVPCGAGPRGARDRRAGPCRRRPGAVNRRRRQPGRPPGRGRPGAPRGGRRRRRPARHGLLTPARGPGAGRPALRPPAALTRPCRRRDRGAGEKRVGAVWVHLLCHRLSRETTGMAGRLRMYLIVLWTVGLSLLVLLAATVDAGRLAAEWPVVTTLAAFLSVGYFFAIPLSRDRRGLKVLINGPFAFALVLYGGIGAAALLQAGAILLCDLAHLKPAAKTSTNIAVHTIGLAAGAGVWTALSGGRAASTATLPAILIGALVFVVVKVALFAIKEHLDDATPLGPARVLRIGVGIIVLTQVVVLLVALGVPTVGAYLVLRSEVGANIRRGEAEQSARREAELRIQEHELRLQQQEVARKLQETDRVKDDLLAMVSHELRNPLATVLGVLRLLSTGAPLSPAERQEMVEMGDRQARRLRSLIEQLLLAARFERGEGEYPSSGADLVEADAAELALQAATEAQAAHRDHPIRVECDGSLPVRVATDAVLQILGNLLDNACKYSPDAQLVRLLAARDGTQAVLAVEDNGAGIPVAERERIFERFTQLGNGRSGLGLGLYIARQLARAQGGDLVLTDARHAGGARFELRIPLRERASPPLAPSAGGDAVVGTAAQHG